MKLKILDYINIALVLILVLLVAVYQTSRYQNKEQDKIMWNAKIYSSDYDNSSETKNLIKIVDVVFLNTFNQAKTGLDYESLRETSGLLSYKNQKHVLCNHFEEQLLPDSIHLKYFSIDDCKFYLLSSKLPYEKIKNLIQKKYAVTLTLEILPKGKINLKMSTTASENKSATFIDFFKSTETNGSIDMLVYEKTLDGKINNYETIKTTTDFSDLLKNKYNWVFKADIDSNTNLEEVSVNTFRGEHIDFDKNPEEFRPIPKEFYIKWGNDKQHCGIQFYFDPFEILNAFRTMQDNEIVGEIVVNFKLLEGKKPECQMIKGNKIITLRNLYPEAPIIYTKYID